MAKARTVIVKLVLALAVVVGAGYFLVVRPLLVGIAETGSGGIGAVSTGFGEMIVELLIAGLLVATIWAITRVVRRRRASSPKPLSPEP